MQTECTGYQYRNPFWFPGAKWNKKNLQFFWFEKIIKEFKLTEKYVIFDWAAFGFDHSNHSVRHEIHKVLQNFFRYIIVTNFNYCLLKFSFFFWDDSQLLSSPLYSINSQWGLNLSSFWAMWEYYCHLL